MKQIIMVFSLLVGYVSASQIPQWAKSGICDEKDCAVGEATKKEGEAAALARALKNLRLSLGTSVQAHYEERTNTEGEVSASAQAKIYASMQNIGYTVLAKVSDDKKIYIKIQYEPNKKILPNEEIGEFSIISNFEKLCKSRDLDGYYCVSLGKKYENGENDLAKNDNIALKYYEQGCKMGTLEGCVSAGNLLQKLSKNEKTSQKTKAFFAKACDKGLGIGCYKLASVESVPTKRRDLYKQGCLLDDALSCAILGEIYEFGLAHLSKNPLVAEQVYDDSKTIDKNGDGATIIASKLKDKARRIREYKKLCEANNARACALLGQEENNLSYLEKASALNSPRGLYFLALKQDSKNTKIELLKKSCSLGEEKDFTKGCLELGNLYAPSQESKEYYAASCNNLFYEKEACEKIYDIAPKSCNNEEICSQIAQTRSASEKNDNYVAKKRGEYANYINKTEDSSSYFSSFGFSPFLTFGLGATNGIKLDKISSSEKFKGDNFVMIVRLGTEILFKKTFSPYIAPYTGVSITDIFDISKFKGTSSSSKTKMLSMVAINVGSQVGVKLGRVRLYGIVDYGHRIISEGGNDIAVPIKSGLGFGGGIGYRHDKAYRLGSWMISAEYMQTIYTYNGGEIRDDTRGRSSQYELKLNNSTHKAKTSVFLVNFGYIF